MIREAVFYKGLLEFGEEILAKLWEDNNEAFLMGLKL